MTDEIPDITVKMSLEMVKQLADWSEPVQVLISRQADGSYEMIARHWPAGVASASDHMVYTFAGEPEIAVTDAYAIAIAKGLSAVGKKLADQFRKLAAQKRAEAAPLSGMRLFNGAYLNIQASTYDKAADLVEKELGGGRVDPD